MTQASQTLVIVPAFNEGPVIRQTLLELIQAEYQVVVIDDASTDDTAAQIADLDLTCLRHPVNLGQGAALQTGTEYARRLELDFLVHFDADGQHRVADIPALLAPLEKGEADLVLGSRFLQAEDRQAVPFWRRLLLRMAVGVNGLLTGLWLSDAHNGLRAMNQQALQRIQLRENRMAHATEILFEIRKHRLRYVEVPVRIRYSPYARRKGQSAWNAFNILADLLFRKLFL